MDESKKTDTKKTDKKDKTKDKNKGDEKEDNEHENAETERVDNDGEKDKTTTTKMRSFLFRGKTKDKKLKKGASKDDLEAGVGVPTEDASASALEHLTDGNVNESHGGRYRRHHHPGRVGSRSTTAAAAFMDELRAQRFRMTGGGHDTCDSSNDESVNSL